MWSAWSETVELYFGRTVAMLKMGDGETTIVQFPATLSTEHALAQLADVVGDKISAKAKAKAKAKATSRRTLRVTLSGALCPAVGFVAPGEVTRWRELRDIARASAAMSLSVNADQLECELDASRPGVASVVLRPVMQQLRRWAEQQHCSIASLQPLWAVASQCRAARQPSVHGLLVQEPDAINVLAEDGHGKFIASTLHGDSGYAPHQANTRRWLVGQGVGEGGLLKLSFSTSSNPQIRHGPIAWATHWTVGE